ncbi:hypothetical protein RHGRI_031915 [Rhododendron griersonianum]|uniref:protein-serine/threonine phosphatase n=1 Tax=Rhododendron griersonianum TaxID=479676 RepID=A0AAV6I9S8_9ERIC|nr:hypothetical protein RHGRI_031915 [Rhododendron griersonianum]
MATMEGVLPFSAASVVEDVLQQHGKRLNDVDLASRKAEEASLRRYEAARWLRKTVGVVAGKDLPAEPSEEDFRLGLRSGIILCNVINKVQPGAIPKVVEAPADTGIIPDGAALSAYQYFENVRNFLVAVEEMGLPTFEASDLEQGGKSSRIVNCVLAMRSYNDWKQGGGNGLWKFGGTSKPTTFGKQFVRKNSEPFMGSLRNLSTEKSLDSVSSEQSLSSDFGNDINQMGTSNSLNMLVRELLSDKKPEEIPFIVENMLGKVMEEFEHRLASQKDHQAKTPPRDVDISDPDMCFPKSSCGETEHKQLTDTSYIVMFKMEDTAKTKNLKEESSNEEDINERSKGLNIKPQMLVEKQHRDVQELKNTLHTAKSDLQFLQMKYQVEFNKLGRHLHGLAYAASGYQRVLEENRKLYNQVQDLKGRELASGTTLRGSMHLVDLAGSERVDKSEVVGDRLKEAQHINKSLSALGDVISSLSQKNSHVPYRNSKLTQLLQDSLGGQAKTLMFVHISPEPDAVGETISTLKFAERVSTVELGAARINKDNSDVKELKEQIANLKAALARKEEEPDSAYLSTLSSPERQRMNSARSSPSHPHWQSAGDVSANRGQPTENVGHLEFRNNTTTSKVKRRSLDPQDFLMNSPPTPPVGSLAASLKEDEKSKPSDWVDKIMLNRQSSHIDIDVTLPGRWEEDNRQPPEMIYQRHSPDPLKIYSEQPFSKLSGNGKESQDNDVHRNRYETAATDESDELEAATSDSSETDLLWQPNLPRVSSVPNGLGLKTKRPILKQVKSPETRYHLCLLEFNSTAADTEALQWFHFTVAQDRKAASCCCWEEKKIGIGKRFGNGGFGNVKILGKMSQTGGSSRMRQKPSLVALGTLIGRELRGEKIEKPTIKYGQAALAKKGEDYFLIKPDCQRIPGNPSTPLSVFAIFDGHNGISAAIFAKENLLNNVLSAIPQGIGREEWLQALPRALVAGETSGTTVTFVVIDGWTVTVASVGDSRCILDTQGGVVSLLTVDHRLEENVEERERVTASGGEVGRLNIFGGDGVGPLRCWPGGLCLSRSIGDTDVGEFIVPIPHVKQVKLSNAGGRLIIASDGIWDALSSDMAAESCRGLPAELAAKLVVKEALRSRGLKDDTTCLVVDIIPFDHPVLPKPSKKKQNPLSSLIFGKKTQNSGKGPKLSAVGAVEELFEEGSAMLAERLGKDFPLTANSGLLRCAICQTDQSPSDGLSVNSGPYFLPASKPWEGPFLCATCRRKKDAMEGKRPSTRTVTA